MNKHPLLLETLRDSKIGLTTILGINIQTHQPQVAYFNPITQKHFGIENPHFAQRLIDLRNDTENGGLEIGYESGIIVGLGKKNKSLISNISSDVITSHPKENEKTVVLYSTHGALKEILLKRDGIPLLMQDNTVCDLWPGITNMQQRNRVLIKKTLQEKEKLQRQIELAIKSNNPLKTCRHYSEDIYTTLNATTNHSSHAMLTDLTDPKTQVRTRKIGEKLDELTRKMEQRQQQEQYQQQYL